LGLLNTDFLDPSYELLISDKEIGTDLSRFITGLEYESADGVVDMAKVNVLNPEGIFTDSKLFQPGNEMSMAFGYGELEFIGRTIIKGVKMSFPAEAEPTLVVTGYTKDFLMMDNAPEKGKDRIFRDATISDIADKVAGRYKMEVDAPDDYAFGKAITQKAGMSDYDFIKGLCNILGWFFWVDGDEDGIWTMHLIDPEVWGADQDKQYTFKYNQGNDSTLLAFEPEFALRDVKTKIRVVARDEQTGKTFDEEVTDDATAPDVVSSGDPEELVEEGQSSGGATVKLVFGDNFAIDTIANKKFRTAAEVTRWAQQWFRRNRQEFVQARGRTIGVEDLFARQTHKVEGLGNTLDGEYYFPRVRHKLTPDQGYELDCNVRKVVT
jgi:phage protein D